MWGGNHVCTRSVCVIDQERDEGEGEGRKGRELGN